MTTTPTLQDCIPHPWNTFSRDYSSSSFSSYTTSTSITSLADSDTLDAPYEVCIQRGKLNPPGSKSRETIYPPGESLLEGILPDPWFDRQYHDHRRAILADEERMKLVQVAKYVLVGMFKETVDAKVNVAWNELTRIKEVEDVTGELKGCQMKKFMQGALEALKQEVGDLVKVRDEAYEALMGPKWDREGLLSTGEYRPYLPPQPLEVHKGKKSVWTARGLLLRQVKTIASLFD